MVDWQQILVYGTKLALASVLGGAIGFEREKHGQAAGLRTYILVCVGSCLMMMLSLHMEELYRHLGVTQSVVRLDPGRIASYAIAGMGFLGAGAIITGRGTVRGLTTAAGLWLVTGIGLAIGASYLAPALMGAAISLLILYVFRWVKAIFHRDEFTLLSLKYDRAEKPLKKIREILGEHNFTIQFINYKAEIPSNTVTYNLRLRSHEEVPWGHIVTALSRTQGIKEIHWQEGEIP
ncbi:MAG: MgtC/SapB family protein [Deltaproteobacteria bacterium]|nr:MgtC/SapB family protein [Deltaproteobacteria bacterium]